MGLGMVFSGVRMYVCIYILVARESSLGLGVVGWYGLV